MEDYERYVHNLYSPLLPVSPSLSPRVCVCVCVCVCPPDDDAA
jgi:hypothetical protein